MAGDRAFTLPSSRVTVVTPPSLVVRTKSFAASVTAANLPDPWFS